MKRPQQQNKRAAASSARVALGAMALAGVAACAFAAAGAGQQQRQQRAVNSGGNVGNGRVSIALYAGETGDVMPAGWGSGKAEVSGENVLVGTRSLKVTTQGLYQGARLDFRNPVDLTQAFAAPNAYLRLQLRFPNVSAGGGGAMGGPGGGPGGPYGGGGPGGLGAAGGRPGGGGAYGGGGGRGGRGGPSGIGGAPGAPGGGGGGPYGGGGGAAGRGGRGGGGGPYGGGGPGGIGDTGGGPYGGGPSGMGGFGGEGVTSPFQRMRFLLVMADGTRHELVRPVSIPPASDDETAYVPLSFPLRALLKGSSKGGNNGQSTERTAMPTGEGARLAQLAVFGDRYQQFFIGEISVLTDDTEIVVDPLDEPIAAINDQITFTGTAQGGASTLKYSWDFDAKDGIQEDQVGQVVTHTYRKAGTYKVTLTVADLDGLKKPSTTSVDVEVAE